MAQDVWTKDGDVQCSRKNKELNELAREANVAISGLQGLDYNPALELHPGYSLSHCSAVNDHGLKKQVDVFDEFSQF